jgi:hypothetical protein
MSQDIRFLTIRVFVILAWIDLKVNIRYQNNYFLSNCFENNVL